MNKEAHKTMLATRSILIMEQPFYGCILMHLKLEEDNSINTMATDGIHLFYNVDYTMSLSEPGRLFVFMHEGAHCSYKHHLRLGDRDLEIWNIAGDYRINYDLVKAGFKMPEVGLYNPAYANFSTEEIYIREYKKQQQQQKQQQQSQASQQQGQGQQGSGSQNPSNGQTKPDKGDQGKGKGNQASGSQSSGRQPFSDPGRMGGVMAPAPKWDTNTLQSEEARWEAITRQAISVAKAKNAGSIPGFLDRVVLELNTPKVDWEAVLRRFVDESMSKTYSWLRPNRRYLHSGLILPGYMSDSINHVLSVMDTSGSVDDKLVAKYGSEKRALLDDGVCDKLTILYADVGIKNVQEYERGDEIKLDPKGGKGTNFRPTFDYITKHHPDASVILFFTDLETVDFGDDPGIPVLWAVYGDPESYRYKSKTVPFGEVIYIER